MSQAGKPRFKSGARVRVDDRPVLGHCRTPWFLRGKRGVVVEVIGPFRNPERLAYHRPGLPREFLYRVRFPQSELWPGYGGAAFDDLEADIYEHWLSPDERA